VVANRFAEFIVSGVSEICTRISMTRYSTWDKTSDCSRPGLYPVGNVPISPVFTEPNL
jgi:hypothetical protein